MAHKDIRFINDEARERFDLLKSKTVIYERGFHIEARGWSHSYVQQIETLGWTTFWHPRTEAMLPWVQEFYANARFHADGRVAVRGKPVDFSARTINTLFEIPHIDDTAYELFKTTVSPMDIAKALCSSPVIEWANESKRILKSAYFRREAKVWMLFVNSSILPTKHPNLVSFDRAFLIYNIILMKPINIGTILFNQIRQQRYDPFWLWPPIVVSHTYHSFMSCGWSFPFRNWFYCAGCSSYYCCCYSILCKGSIFDQTIAYSSCT